MSPLAEVAARFFRLGLVAFGGPAAHIAMMDDEFVERRRWLGRQRFLDLMGATNLIPGPNSTEMTMHLGYERAGPLGLVVAGLCFILPAALVTGVFAWAYVAYGSLPAVEPFLYGIKPAVLAVIAGALWKLGRKAIKRPAHGVIAALVALAVWVQGDEVLWLFVGGLGGALALRGIGATAAAVALLAAPAKVWAATETAAAAVTLPKLGLFFLKIGAVLYGSGYVLIAFLEGGLVDDLGWLTQEQLLDAVAVGQFTPGPVLTTATFVGYVVAGVPGAVVATLGIFLPSFGFTLVLHPLVERMRKSDWTAAFLDAVNASALALMAVVTLQLGQSTLVSWPAWVIAAASALLVFKTKVSSAWIAVGGAAAGWLLLRLAG